MNRSLEALAIFSICLGGILAVVRCSTVERTVTEPSVAERPVEVAPAKNAGSAVEQPAVEQFAADFDLAYSAGCGLDRNNGHVYAPQSPLLSPREVAQRAIRSLPIPLVVLPEVADELADRTGYDAAFDAAMGDASPETGELSRKQIEAEYAAAELAAAAEGSPTGVFSQEPAPSELTPASPTWDLISGGLSTFRNELLHNSRQLQISFAPIARGIENRLLRMSFPSLRYPRAKSEAREPLLHRQQAVHVTSGVTWGDYLAFVDRALPVEEKEAEPREMTEPRVARPRNVLWPR
jgi:hypothetical protein